MLYVGQICVGFAAGLAAQLFAGLTMGCIIGAIGVANCAGALQAVFVKLVVWFEEFWVLYHSVCALI